MHIVQGHHLSLCEMAEGEGAKTDCLQLQMIILSNLKRDGDAATVPLRLFIDDACR